jgi:hypothetical protein
MKQNPSACRRIISALFVALLLCCAFSVTPRAATLSPTLGVNLNGLADNAAAGVVIVAFRTTSGLGETHLNILRGLGVTSARTLPRLGMVAFPATAGQVRALATNSEVRSIWSNDRLSYYDNQARTVAGVDRMRAERQFTALNGGFPVTGQGNFSVVINDSGIDATHDDLKLGDHVVQNVRLVTATETQSGFTPVLANTTVTFNGAPLTDNASIPAALRGYVQLAINKGLFEAFPAELRQVSPGQFIALPGPRFEPNTVIMRAQLAGKLVLFNQAFVAGQ